MPSSPLLFRRPSAIVNSQPATRSARQLGLGDLIHRVGVMNPRYVAAVETLLRLEYARLEPLWPTLEDELRRPS